MIDKKELRNLIKTYNLTNEEIYQVDAYIHCVTATGIRKIITHDLLNVAKKILFAPDGTVAVITRVEVGSMMEKGHRYYEATGEAKHGLNTNFKFPVAVAEARSMGRAVLMYCGLYERGVIAEAEFDHETEAAKIHETRKKQADLAVSNLLKKVIPNGDQTPEPQASNTPQSGEQGTVAPQPRKGNRGK